MRWYSVLFFFFAAGAFAGSSAPTSFVLSDAVEKSQLRIERIPITVQKFSPAIVIDYEGLGDDQLANKTGGASPVEAYRLYLAALKVGDRSLFEQLLSSGSRERHQKKSDAEWKKRVEKSARWFGSLELRVTHQFMAQGTAYLRIQTYGLDNGVRKESIRFLQSAVHENGVWLGTSGDKTVLGFLERNFLAPSQLGKNTRSGWVGEDSVLVESPTPFVNTVSLIHPAGEKQ